MAQQIKKKFLSPEVINYFDDQINAVESDISSLQSSKADKTYVDSQDDAKLAEAKSYTDTQIATIPPVDLSPYETIANVDSKDAAKLVEAKAYTDAQIAAIPAVDLSGYYTKPEVDAKESALDARLDTLEAFGYEQVVHVSKNGSDSNTGKQHSPFLTITAAMNAISDASPSKRYAVKVAPGSYTESTLALKANVFVIGEGQKESVRITGAVSMGSSFTANSSFDNRSGFSMVTLLSAANFDWNAVQSAAGKLYFNEVLFGSTVNMNGYNNAIAQAQFNACVIFGALTVSGINIGVFTDNVCFGNINLNQHPNGGMATILTATGGYCSGTISQVTTVNDFNRRVSSFLRGFPSEVLIVNGPSSYADADLVSQSKQGAQKLNGGQLIALTPKIHHDIETQMITPLSSNSHNLGDWGKQWMFNFGYVHASSGTDLYLTSVDSSYDSAGSSTGYSINIEADGYGLKPNVNGGDVKIVTATPSGTGTRGKVQLNGSEIDVTSKKITNLADGTISTDAINKGQLDSVQNGLQSQITTEKGRVDAILLAADADKDSFAEIVSLINSVDTSNDTAFAGYVSSNNARVDALEAKGFSKGSQVVGSELSFIDLDRQYSTILSMSVGRLAVHEGEDYTVSVVGGVTRITWIGSLLNPTGSEKIETGDKVFWSGSY